MTLTINLTPELEKRVKRARENGIDVDALLKGVISALPDRDPTTETGAELVARLRREGVIGAWANRDDIKDSVEFARELRRNAERRCDVTTEPG